MSYYINNKKKIVEKETGVLIHIPQPEENDPNVICRKLNLGSGFDGWTPDFFNYVYK